MYGKAYLINKLNTFRRKVKAKYDYYEQENWVYAKSISIPAKILRDYHSRLGWCTKAVDLLADRLMPRRIEGDTYGIYDLYADNNADILYGAVVKGALISGCDFVWIYQDENNDVRLQVVGGSNATGILDDTTSLLTEGYAVLSRNPDKPSEIWRDAYFTPNETYFHDHVTGDWAVPNNTGLCLLVPVINDPKPGSKQFGHSRISKAMMRTQDQAELLLARLNIMTEVNSWPQKYVTGLEQGTDIDTLKATFSSMLRFDKDGDGDRPTLGQFSQMSFQDHINELDMYASLFAGESALTRDDLGFVTENPSSAESKKAALEALRVIAGKCQSDFSTALLNIGYTAACLKNKAHLSRNIIKGMKVIWKPLVEPDFSALSAIGDGILKINQAVPGYFDAQSLADIIGIDGKEQSDGGLLDIDILNQS